MKVTVIPILTCGFDTATKELAQRLEDIEIRGQVETIQTTNDNKRATLREKHILF